MLVELPEPISAFPKQLKVEGCNLDPKPLAVVLAQEGSRGLGEASAEPLGTGRQGFCMLNQDPTSKFHWGCMAGPGAVQLTSRVSVCARVCVCVCACARACVFFSG